MTVRLPDGRTMDVPKNLSGDKLANYVAAEEKRRAEATAAAEAAARHAAEQAEKKKVEEISLQQQLDAANARADAMAAEIEKLRMATPEASAATMALMHATQQATNLRLQLQQDTGEISKWWSKNLGAVDDTAAELRRKNEVLDEEKAARQLDARRFMNSVAIAQGLPAPHPHLLEETDAT